MKPSCFKVAIFCSIAFIAFNVCVAQATTFPTLDLKRVISEAELIEVVTIESGRTVTCPEFSDMKIYHARAESPLDGRTLIFRTTGNLEVGSQYILFARNHALPDIEDCEEVIPELTAGDLDLLSMEVIRLPGAEDPFAVVVNSPRMWIPLNLDVKSMKVEFCEDELDSACREIILFSYIPFKVIAEYISSLGVRVPESPSQ